MIEWTVGVLAILIGYIAYLLNSTDHVNHEDHTIDAFIIKDDLPRKSQDIKSRKDNKYKTNYLTEGKQVLILFGTEYGFSEEVARAVFDRLSSTLDSSLVPQQPRLVNAKYHSHISWSHEQLCIITIATSGDGVPPSDAREFFDDTMTSSRDLSNLKYCVLALGDSNYPQFCRTGKQIDQRFHELSAERLMKCQTVDMEDWSVINEWLDKMTTIVSDLQMEVKLDYLDVSSLGQGEGHSRNNPFNAQLKVKRSLSKIEESGDKETIHCEFDITGSGLTWTSGDALGIYPENNPFYVDQILRYLGYNGTEDVEVPVWANFLQNKIDIRTALMRFYDIKHVKTDLLQILTHIIEESHGKLHRKDSLQPYLEIWSSTFAVNSYMKTREVLDVLEEVVKDLDLGFLTVSPDRFLSCLKPLQPRYYSISSSPLMDSNTVCITAAVVRYKIEETKKNKEGATTAHLQDRMVVMDTCPVFVSRNPDFRLPSNHELPIILIGPGTGISPFRAFIQEREINRQSASTSGRVLMYFGCRHREKDFLYREELERWHSLGVIVLRTAFSRDQQDKIYVQDLLWEDRESIWHVIDACNGSFYVCGDASQMAHDVHKVLLKIAQVQGHFTDIIDAQCYMDNLEKQCRYQKDVWVT